MSLLPWKRLDRGRLFEIECECGAIFRIPFDPEEIDYHPDRRLLIPLEGACPECGLRVEEIEPFAGSPSPPAGRSRA